MGIFDSQQSGTQTVTQTGAPFQVPYQQYGLNQAYNAYQNPGTMVAPFAPQQEQAIQGITDLTNNPQALNAASDYTTNVLRNGPTQNPYLDAMFGQAAQRSQSQLASEFAGAGRNVDQSAGLRGQQLNDLATQIYGGAFNTGVQQQMGAAQLAPTINNTQYANQNALFGAGGQVQNLANQYIQAPQNALNQYLNRTNGFNLGTQTSQPLYSNPLGSALGGASLGSALGGLFGGNGSTYGSILGGLAGYFGG